jgi:hypothetical protein
MSQQCLTADWTNGVRSPAGADDFSSSPYVQTGCGVHQVFYPVGTGGKMRPKRDADYSPLSSTDVKNELKLYLLFPPSAAMACSGTDYFTVLTVHMQTPFGTCRCNMKL